MTEKDTANIGTPERVPLTDLNLYHKNPRVGDTQAIKGSIVANGIFRPVVVNKGTYTDKPNEILAGNHTVKAIRELAEEHPDDARWQHVDVWMVDVDAERAARIVLADNRTADLGSYDNEELLGLLDMMDGDLDGTQTRSFCFVSDLVRGLMLMGESSATGPVNLGNPTERTVLDAAEVIIKLTNSTSRVVKNPLPSDDPVKRKPDISVAQEILGWNPETPFIDGVRETIQWFNQEGYGN